MTDEVEIPPRRSYARTDPGVDPPSISLGFEIEARMREGSVILFLDQEAEEVAIFELHRTRGVFRICSPFTQPAGAFASAQAAIQAGWAAVDAGGMRAEEDLPPLDALPTKADPTGGAA